MEHTWYRPVRHHLTLRNFSFAFMQALNGGRLWQSTLHLLYLGTGTSQVDWE